MAITASDVKKLRDITGAGMMDCKKALNEANGDMAQAEKILKEMGLAAVAKRQDRATENGRVFVDAANGKAVLLELSCETDFVAKNESFQEFAKIAAKAVIDNNPASVEELLAVKVGDQTVQELLQDRILVIRENLKIRRFERYEGAVATYVHGGGKIGVMVKFDTDVADKEGFAEYGKNIAMQVAAANPLYVCECCVPEEVIEHEKEIALAQINNDPKMAAKPDVAKAKIVEGKINKYYKENCLVDQEYVKEPDLTIKAYSDKVAKELGGSIKIVSFVRMEKGEGIEKREENFAEEVAKQIAGK